MCRKLLSHVISLYFSCYTMAYYKNHKETETGVNLLLCKGWLIMEGFNEVMFKEAMSNVEMPKIDYGVLNALADPALTRNYNLADYAHELIMEEIRAFEEGLDENHEVAIKLTSFGQSITLAVTDIGYANPSTLFFYGFVGDQQATLIQHMSQLNFLLLAVPKEDPEKPARRIGFIDKED